MLHCDDHAFDRGQFAVSWVGAGKGWLKASVEAGEHGGMTAEGKIVGNDTLNNVFAEMGTVIADTAAAARK